MNIADYIPTMQEQQVLDRARAFATDLAARLTKINEEHPRPNISKEAWEYLQTTYGEKIPHHWPPEKMIGAFTNSFCKYMQSRYVLIP